VDYSAKWQLLRRGAPENFDQYGGRRTFVKIHYARHQITLSETEPAHVLSEVRFTNSEQGTPIIDFYNEPYSDVSVRLNGSADVGVETVPTPDRSPYEYRVIKSYVPADVLQVAWFDYRTTTIRLNPVTPLFFQMSDYEDPSFLSPASTPYRARCFLDRYLPANLEFDQHPVDISVSLDSQSKARLDDYEVFSNGSVIRRAGNRVDISFPETFTASSHFLVAAHKDTLERRDFDFARTLGDASPLRVTIFATGKEGGTVCDHAEQAFAAVRELDQEFGTFPYEKLLLYSKDTGAMEYVGAAEVSGSHVPHEILHSYVGRGLMPANGDAGWFDEAVATWVELGCQLEKGVPPKGSDCGNRGRHHRRTAPDSVGTGEVLMRHLAYLVNLNGGDPGCFLELMHKLTRIARRRTMRAKEIEELFASLSGLDCKSLFETFVYGGHQPI
jgi:hypothetical protein